jgi:hypothetical protein
LRRPFHWYRTLFRAALQSVRQQTVDGVHAALEINPRSSYVPSAHRRSVPASGDAPPNSALARPEMPAWMK